MIKIWQLLNYGIAQRLGISMGVEHVSWVKPGGDDCCCLEVKTNQKLPPETRQFTREVLIHLAYLCLSPKSAEWWVSQVVRDCPQRGRWKPHSKEI